MLGKIRNLALLLVEFCLSGCVGVAAGITPVQDFDVNRYLGTWYEIARLDHSFERGLEKVTADYSLREDGGVRVINSGYSIKTGERKVAEGKAYFVSDKTRGHLKVSFFGPFYGSYVVFDLDREGYQYAFLTSYSKDFLWLLARKPAVSDGVIDKFVAEAKGLGFDTAGLIFVNQLGSANSPSQGNRP